MALSTKVKVGNISNLSDARYCSGMGVDLLGFSVIEGQPDYISPKLFQEIRGWVSGPKIVAQIYGFQSKEDLQKIIEQYAPDLLEMSWQEYRRFEKDFPLPCVVRIDEAFVQEAMSEPSTPLLAYFICSEATVSAAAKKIWPIPVLLQVTATDSALELLKSHDLQGVSLSGSPEIRPGFKDYEHLSEVLEMLDTD